MVQFVLMPVLKHAKKKLRVDKRRQKVNKVVKTRAKKAIDQMRKEPGEKELKKVFSAVDRAAKKGVYHKRKANRLKARLTKLISKVSK